MRGEALLFGTAAAAMLLVPVLVLHLTVAPVGTLTVGEEGEFAYVQQDAPVSGSSSASAPIQQGSTSALRENDSEHTQAITASPSGEGVYQTEICEFHILNTSTGKIETVPLRDYVLMALASEMPADFHLEALKAQGVAALSYALYQAKLHRAQPLQELLGADFAADPDHRSGYMTQESAEEFYGDQFAVSWKKLTEAADAAANYVMLYEGEPIAAAYHAISCGMTEASENIWISSLPYLQAVDSSWDILASGYRSKVEISGEEFRTRMEEEEITLKGTAGEWIEVMETSASGYVICVRVGDREMTGLQLRDLLGLRSACFTLVPSGANLTFEVRGYGHGAGLSQNGADYLARQGWDFERILKHYYTGVELARLQNY